MKKSLIILAVVLASFGIASAQYKSIFTDIPQVKTSVYSTPRVTNYNSTYNSGFGSSLTKQTYKTPSSYTTVSTTRTSFGDNNYMSGTDVFSNGSRRSSSRTSSIDFGGSRMTTTTYYDSFGNVKSRRIRTKSSGW
jgi:hypothetical protein